MTPEWRNKLGRNSNLSEVGVQVDLWRAFLSQLLELLTWRWLYIDLDLHPLSLAMCIVW